MTVTIEDKSAEFLDALEGASRAALLKVGREAGYRAEEQFEPGRVTGRYHRSIKKKVIKDGEDWVLNFGSTNPLSHIIEWGSVHQRPFHTIEKASAGMPDDFAAELSRRAEKIKV